MKVFHPGETWMSSGWLFYVERKGIRNAMCDDTARLRIQKYAASVREKCPDVPLNVHPICGDIRGPCTYTSTVWI